MKKLGLSLTICAAAGPALAHSGAHLHPHDGASWMVVASALALMAPAGGLAVARARR